ncbi:MAG TPA: hypothetical protein PKD85_13350, partial [Saprospiraceae bacterium]|nr:hypothetical protein [Saprospiraceae bacterium]
RGKKKAFEKERKIKFLIGSNDIFWFGKAKFNTSTATFFGLDWANKSAHCLVCSECTHIMWFLG